MIDGRALVPAAYGLRPGVLTPRDRSFDDEWLYAMYELSKTRVTS
jgi:hypothetical protein